MRGSRSSSVPFCTKAVSLGLRIGLEMRIFFLNPFLERGEMIEEMMLEAREPTDLDSSGTIMFAGRCFSIFFDGEPLAEGEPIRAGEAGPWRGNGRGISFTATPAALASSCSITCAYISSRSRSIIC